MQGKSGGGACLRRAVCCMFLIDHLCSHVLSGVPRPLINPAQSNPCRMFPFFRNSCSNPSSLMDRPGMRWPP